LTNEELGRLEALSLEQALEELNLGGMSSAEVEELNQLRRLRSQRRRRHQAAPTSM
jgi:hypothetical protein